MISLWREPPGSCFTRNGVADAGATPTSAASFRKAVEHEFKVNAI
jgi:hypothetical protein